MLTREIAGLAEGQNVYRNGEKRFTVLQVLNDGLVAIVVRASEVGPHSPLPQGWGKRGDHWGETTRG